MVSAFIQSVLALCCFLPMEVPIPVMADLGLYQIMLLESRGDQSVKLHPDKTSYGLFGLTETACAEVGEEWPPESPEDELRAARKYYSLMISRHKAETNEEAQGWYHGGSPERREAYVGKLQKLEPDIETLEMFARLCQKTETTGK